MSFALIFFTTCRLEINVQYWLTDPPHRLSEGWAGDQHRQHHGADGAEGRALGLQAGAQQHQADDAHDAVLDLEKLLEADDEQRGHDRESGHGRFPLPTFWAGW